jgi:hypothetical protein
MLEGPNRRVRARMYMNYLHEYYGVPTHQLYVVANVGHDALELFNSRISREVLFG